VRGTDAAARDGLRIKFPTAPERRGFD
jgi:hypothetical protein